MTDKPGPKGAPIRVGKDLSEDEATVLDVTLDDLHAKRPPRDAAKPLVERAKRPPPPSVADEDLERTELLERPLIEDATSQPNTPPPRGVVPLGGDAARLVGRQSAADRAAPKTAAHDLDDDGETHLLSRPPTESAEAATSPPVRPLDEVSFVAIVEDGSEDKTLSRPKIARMTFRPAAQSPLDSPTGAAFADTHKRPVSVDPGDAQRAPRPLPPPSTLGKKGPPRVRRPAASVADGPEGEARVGHIVVEAPREAVVFVDGVERGRGAVEIGDVDRFASVGVRVHLAGHKPWNKTVSLEGKAELRVTPELEPRG